MEFDDITGKTYQLNISEISRGIDYSRTHLQSVLSGRYRMGLKLARALERYFNGKYTYLELLDMSDRAVARFQKREARRKELYETID